MYSIFGDSVSNSASLGQKKEEEIELLKQAAIHGVNIRIIARAT
jgi:hypothetical protein